MEPPREPPPPRPTPGRGDPDLGLDCQVPLTVDAPHIASSSPVPAYLETDLDFTVSVDTNPVNSGPSRKDSKSDIKFPNVPDLANDNSNRCLGSNGNKPHLKHIGKQQSLDNECVKQPPDVSSHVNKAQTGVSQVELRVRASDDSSPSHTQPNTDNDNAQPANKAKLIRKFSADSNINTQRPQQELFESQRKSYNIGCTSEVDTDQGVSPVVTFSTFKPVGKPTPAPRLSLGGPQRQP